MFHWSATTSEASHIRLPETWRLEAQRGPRKGGSRMRRPATRRFPVWRRSLSRAHYFLCPVSERVAAAKFQRQAGRWLGTGLCVRFCRWGRFPWLRRRACGWLRGVFSSSLFDALSCQGCRAGGSSVTGAASVWAWVLRRLSLFDRASWVLSLGCCFSLVGCFLFKQQSCLP